MKRIELERWELMPEDPRRLKYIGQPKAEEIYKELTAYTASLPLPEWAKEELEEAVAMGITDGTDPMGLIPRYQAAIMAKRAVQKGKVRT